MNEMFILNGREERVLNLLRPFNLNASSSKAYFTLLMLGRSKAGVIARRSGVPQSKIYSILYDLANRGLVNIISINPKEFEANEIEHLVKAFIRAKRNEIYRAVRSGEELKRILESLKEATTNPLVMPIKVFQPRYGRVGANLSPSRMRSNKAS